MKPPSLGRLAPINLETPGCESLSSYVQRLAAAHGTLPGPLVHRLVAWIANSNWAAVGSWARRTGVVRLGHNINGFGHADHWLRIITLLTGRSDLLRLTTRLWDSQFPTRGFLRPDLAWCPQCLIEDRIPYHRLLWLFRLVTFCPEHLVPLAARCEACGRSLPVIHERSGVTHCPWCADDLRNSTRKRGSFEPNSFSCWCATELGQIVAASGAPNLLINWDPATALRRLQKARDFNNAAEFAQFVGTSRITAWYWLSGAARPSLESCLRIYFRFGVSFAEQLVGHRTSVEAASGQTDQNELYLHAERTSRKIDWLVVRRTLKAALDDPITDARSLSAIAREIAVDRRLLRCHEPGLCRKIGKRYQRGLRRQAAAREKILRQEIREACAQLIRARIPVTKQKIATALGREGLFCRHNARKIFASLVDQSARRLSCGGR